MCVIQSEKNITSYLSFKKKQITNLQKEIDSLKKLEAEKEKIENVKKHKQYLEKLSSLSKQIFNAIALEREEESEHLQKTKKPYPPLFTNYLIRAYAWNALDNSEQLNKLSQKLAERLGYKKGEYKNEFTEQALDHELDNTGFFVP